MKFFSRSSRATGPTMRVPRGLRPALHDANDVADLGLVLLVVRVQLARAAHDLLVLGMRLGRVDPHGDRLVRLVGDDDAAALLAPAQLARLARLAGVRAALPGHR